MVHFTTYAVAAKVAGGRGRCAHFSLSVDRLRGMEGEAAYYDMEREWLSTDRSQLSDKQINAVLL